ncbi:MAG: cytochrome c [Terracidiphilus sp.]|nr:cytochrome c [Terracidiphilus sp.]
MKKVLVVLALFAACSMVTWAEDGAAIFKTKCAMCHGASGEGKGKMGAKLSGTAKSVDQISALLTKGGGAVHHAKPAAGVTPEQAKAVATFVKSLK